jgi:hypothetical protein
VATPHRAYRGLAIRPGVPVFDVWSHIAADGGGATHG